MSVVSHKAVILMLFCGQSLLWPSAFAQAILEADGPGNTYELINSVFAPGYDVVEHPECVHPEFGRHIAEVWDAELGQYVFEFYAHVSPDNDRCINFDRQRVEIKTYDQSPDTLIGVVGETITYKWKFRLADGFQPSTSFTHIHQIKAVGGTDADPIFTLTPRKGSPNRIELKHDNLTVVATAPLSSFLGTWVECAESLSVGTSGTYSMTIKRVSDGATLLSYSNENILTIRADNDFIRPKWGIYRSLLNSSDLRDDSVRFAGFSIEEGGGELPVQLASFTATAGSRDATLNWRTASEVNNVGWEIERRAIANPGSTIADHQSVGFVMGAGTSTSAREYTFTDHPPMLTPEYALSRYAYRLKQLDSNGSATYSGEAEVEIGLAPRTLRLGAYPNPFNPTTTIDFTLAEEGVASVRVFDMLGQELAVPFTGRALAGRIYQVPFDSRGLVSGAYIVRLSAETQSISTKIILTK